MTQQTAQQNTPQGEHLFSIRRFAERHCAFLTEGALRAQRFDANSADRYGFGRAGAFVQIGRRVLVHEPRYLAAILSPKPATENHRRAPKPKGKTRSAARDERHAA